MMQRPASVIVFGVLNLAFGALSIFGLAIMAFATLATMNQPNQLFDQTGVFRIWTFISLATATFGVIALFASGVGLLQMRPWARNLAIVYAALTIVTTLIGLAMHWVYVAQPILERFADDDSPDAIASKFGAIGGFIGGFIGMIYPVLLWFFMTRPQVLAAFAAQHPSTAAQHPSTAAPSDAGPVARNEPVNPFSAPATAELPVWAPEAGAPSAISETFIPGKNGPALAAFFLGLLAVFPCLGFPLGVTAVYFGIQGIRRVRKSPEVRGGVHAWIGTICGALFGLANLALIALMIIGLAMS